MSFSFARVRPGTTLFNFFVTFFLRFRSICSLFGALGQNFNCFAIGKIRLLWCNVNLVVFKFWEYFIICISIWVPSASWSEEPNIEIRVQCKHNKSIMFTKHSINPYLLMLRWSNPETLAFKNSNYTPTLNRKPRRMYTKFINPQFQTESIQYFANRQ